VVGHNLTLGKNCALSAAFAQCACKRKREGGPVAFYSIVHDFAEEGRADCMAGIEKTRKLGIAVWKLLYPAAGAVRYGSPSRRNALLLKKAGFDARTLFNPVEEPIRARPAPGKSETAIERKLSLIAKIDGTRFDAQSPSILYPCRCISRKNILEALLLATFVYKANLLLGIPGASSGDKAFYKRTKALCKKHQLLVVFDCGRIVRANVGDGFPAQLFGVADACISTSIAEGFGYAFHEPWLHGKAVFGRRPLGFVDTDAVFFPDLHDRVPIPATWVSLPDLAARYHAAMRTCFGHVKGLIKVFDTDRFNEEFAAYFVTNKTVDFGCLDAATQFAVVSDLLQCPAKVEEWSKVCEREIAALLASFKRSMRPNNPAIRRNELRIQKNFSMEAFSRHFARYLTASIAPARPRGDVERIAREFCSLSKFRLLMTPP
jgi:hypothetical protein